MTACIAGMINSDFAKAQTKDTWEVTLPKSIAWQKSTSVGSLLLYNYAGLYCVDNTNGKILWERSDFKNANNISEDNIEEIPNSPFISITKGNKGGVEILDLMEGKTVFSSETNNYSSITRKQFLYQNNTILIGGYKNDNNKDVSYSMIDMSSGKELWAKEKGEFKLFLGCFSVSDNDVIVATGFDIIRINAKTGSEVWRKSIDQAFKQFSDKNPKLAKGLGSLMGSGAEKMAEASTGKIFFIPNDKESFILAVTKQNMNSTSHVGMHAGPNKEETSITYSTVYNCYNVNSGDFVWKNKLTVNDKEPLDLTTEKGLVIVSNSDNRIGMYDYVTGKAMWDKKIESVTSGSGSEISGILEVKDKLILSDKAGEKTRLKVYKVADGSPAYEGKIDKISGSVSQLRDLPKGILVVTSEVVNMLNIATGKFYFEKDIKSNANLITEKDDQLYIFSNQDNSIYVLSKTGSSVKKLSATTIEFQGKESPAKIEARAEGILLTSDQNIALVDYKGKKIYQKYYEAPGESGLMKSLNLAAGIYASMVAVEAGVYSAELGATSAVIGNSGNSGLDPLQAATAQASDQAAGAAAKAGKYAGYYFSRINARFKATSQGNDYTVVLYRTPEKKNNLIIVNKKTGEIEKQIDISKDKTPNYSVDFVGKALYYIPQKDNKLLQCFQF